MNDPNQLTDDQALDAFLALDIEDDGVSLESLFELAAEVGAKYED